MGDERGFQHIHVILVLNSATVAMLRQNILGGPTWSFTVHGPEEFDKADHISLAKKINASLFVVTISSYGRAQIYRLLDHKHWSKVKVVRCGVDSAFLSRLGQTSIPARPRLVCVGRICEQKGQLLALIDVAQRRRAIRSNWYWPAMGSCDPKSKRLWSSTV